MCILSSCLVEVSYLELFTEYIFLICLSVRTILTPCLDITVECALSDHSKTDITKVVKPYGCLMQVKSTAECSNGPALSDYHSTNLVSFFFFECMLETGFTI